MRIFFGYLAPDHEGDYLAYRQIFEIGGLYIFSVAHDSDPVDDIFELFKAVRDINYALAHIFELVYYSEKLLRFALGQRRARLVHDYNIGVCRESLCNLDHLLF